MSTKKLGEKKLVCALKLLMLCIEIVQQYQKN